jgi:putative sigma-54 modulation protein
MVITYTGKQIDVRDEMKDYLEKRMKKIKFFFDQVMTVKVILKHQRGKFTTEIKLSANRDTYFAKETDEDWKKTFDKVTDKIESEVKKKKDRIKDHKGPTEKK